MAQRILFEREVEKRLLELYQELDRRVGEILRDNQYDLAKAAKISLLLPGELSLGEAGDRLLYKQYLERLLARPPIYLRGKIVKAYISGIGSPRPVLVISITGLGAKTKLNIEIDLRNRKITEIILIEESNSPEEGGGSAILKADDTPPRIGIYEEDSITLANFASALEKERETIKQIVEDVLRAPIDLQGIEKAAEIAIDRELEKLLLITTSQNPIHPLRSTSISLIGKALYALALLPSIKK